MVGINFTLFKTTCFCEEEEEEEERREVKKPNVTIHTTFTRLFSARPLCF